MEYYANKTALITGAASGIGRGLALELARLGANVVLIDINKDNLDSVVDEINSAGGTASGYLCDVSDRHAVYRTARKILSESRQVDILINNAGVVAGKYFWEIPDEEIERAINVNLLATAWTIKAFLPDMIRRNSGHLVTIASAGGIIGVPKLSEYSTTKFGAFGLDESLRLEFRKKNLNIYTTVVCPYFINTGMFAGVKTRFSFILPILDQEYVVRRIIRAVSKRKPRLIMPRFAYVVWLCRYLPVPALDWLAKFFGITNAMDGFTGRMKKDKPVEEKSIQSRRRSK